MKHLFAILPILAILSACSQGTDDNNLIVDPDLHPTRLNTGKLLSMDGEHVHLAFDYDAEGRVVRAERFDTTWHVVKWLAEYNYANDRIYIKYQEFAEMANGEHDPNYNRDFCHYDTLFLVGGRVDSLAGFRPQSRQVGENCHFLKFRYNERGELISIRNDNVKRYPYARYKAGEPWYTELYTLEWQDGNITGRTCTIPQQKKTETWKYSYSELTGSLPGSDPRNVLFELVPLISNGFFGADCRNLMQSVEADDFTEQIEYLQDEQQMVSQMKSNVTFDDGVIHDYAYNIHWCDSN
ncbi:MAG: hypothetical protein J6T78_05095 [Bacteroidaceae bacterium]|nr:hypothetical protein [Bacteroidaceae bacterium]